MKSKRIMFLLFVILALFALCACGSTSSTPEQVTTPEPTATPEPTPEPGPAADYSKAMALVDEEDFANARDIFASLGDYENSAEMVNRIDGYYIRQDIVSTKVGSTFFMGTYEQDNVLHNGSEPIEWLVIREEDNRILAISLYCLDSKKFNDTPGENVTWANSSIREWLNGEFYETAFTDAEKHVIPETLIDNSEDNHYRGTDSGVNTKDHVFLLSYEELNYARMEPEFGMWDFDAKATTYAKKNGAVVGKWGTAWWWLRTAGKNTKYIMYVDFNSVARNTGFEATHPHSGLRPAIWISKSDVMM